MSVQNSSKKTSEKSSHPSLLLVGRDSEQFQVRACLTAGRNILIEGPVGVGKTHLALAIAGELGLPVFRVDGDSRYTEQKLSGWFDPPLVMKSGFNESSFITDPLVEAMRAGGVLFINELNRLPEGVQNILLPAIDERVVVVPRLGTVSASENFRVIATQNPKEFVATSHLSEAILDRFELVVLDYQTQEDEIKIVVDRLQSSFSLKQKGNEQGKVLSQRAPGPAESSQKLATTSVRLTRLTRTHPRVKRGASVRAALSIAEIAQVMLRSGESFEKAFLTAALLALPTRIEIEPELDERASLQQELASLIQSWCEKVLKDLEDAVKKKS